MKEGTKKAIVSVLALALLVSLCFSCGGGGGGKGTTITIGEITDLTGPGSPALIPLHYVMQDLVKYYNEKGLIPGVKLRLVSYDGQYNQARTIPGYEWCKERGAKVILSCYGGSAETLKPFAERDKVPVASAVTSQPLLSPPGWVFCLGSSYADQARALLRWISENHWDYTQGIPKVGFVAWTSLAATELATTIKEYCQSHPGEFEWGGSFLVPVGRAIFAGEVERLKDCDYIMPYATPTAYFGREFRNKGYGATFISDSSAASFFRFFVDSIGWNGLDGFLSTQTCRWWDEQYPIVELANELLQTYRAGESEKIIHSGGSYVGGVTNFYALLEIVRQAIEEVGAEQFDGQAFYDTAITFRVQYDGFPEWYFTETDRSLIHHAAVYEWRAQTETLVRVSDWLPFTTD
jgi:ABC-type branched-subunit amino acid transport system substrate-binding protein